MDFARNQLTKHGWTAGQGLGKDEDGIKEAVKVKIKQDKKGVGHDPGEEFSFHWWDHVFNKAASKIQVNSTEDGVEIKNTGDTNVTKKKNGKTYDNKAMLYGQFVKGSTLTNGLEARETTLEDTSDEEAGETTQCLMPDQEEVVFKMCGGRTAHKGARHGLKLNGKLLRIQEQENSLTENTSSKLSSEKIDSSIGKKNSRRVQLETEVDVCNEEITRKRLKKSKRKKRKYRENDDEISDNVRHIEDSNKVGSVELEDVELKNEIDLENTVKSKKKKRKQKELDSGTGSTDLREEGKTGQVESVGKEECEELEDTEVKHEGELERTGKSKKKSKKRKREETTTEDNCKTDEHVSESGVNVVETKETGFSNSLTEETEITEVSYKKKKKKNKE